MACAALHTMTIAPPDEPIPYGPPFSKVPNCSKSRSAPTCAAHCNWARTAPASPRRAAGLGRPAVLVLAGAGYGGARRHDRHVVCPDARMRPPHCLCIAHRKPDRRLDCRRAELLQLDLLTALPFLASPYTQDPARDPELMFPKARNRIEYIVEISAVMFWVRRAIDYPALALGRPLAGRG